MTTMPLRIERRNGIQSIEPQNKTAHLKIIKSEDAQDWKNRELLLKALANDAIEYQQIGLIHSLMFNLITNIGLCAAVVILIVNIPTAEITTKIAFLFPCLIIFFASAKRLLRLWIRGS